MSRQLAADPDALIHNGAELLDRLIKDIVSDQAATYVSSLAAPLESTAADGEPVASGSSATDDGVSVSMPTAFSLERFIPLLEERIMTRNPKTRSFLVAWLGTLDSIPELELVTYLPNFLDGLLNFLKDEHTEVRTGTFNSLAEFLREIREIAEVQAEREEQRTRRRERLAEKRKQEPVDENAPSQNHPETPATIESASTVQASTSAEDSESESDEDASDDGAGLGSWMPGQGVLVRHAEIVEILITRMVDFEVDQSIQAVCLRWLREFLHFAEPTILSFVPKLAPIVLSALSHPIPSLRQLAETLNDDLYQVIQQLPSPSVQSGAPTTNQDQASPSTAPSPLPPQQQQTQTEKPNRIPHLIERVTKGPSPTPHHEAEQKDTSIDASDEDPLDFQATVTALAILLGAEEEESRLAALHWLSMLHLKAPNKVLSREDGTFPALLKTLSDTSEDVIRSDLQLLAQISSYGDEEYFNNFMLNLVRLFSTDRGLLEQRGRLIVGQLCTCLNAELIFRTLAKILEDEEVWNLSSC